MLHSVLRQRGDLDLHVHYVHEPSLPAARREAVAGMVRREGGEIDFVAVPDEQLEGLPTTGFTRKATWYRIFLPELLTELDRVLFLDADLIALDSLASLWAVDLGDHYLAAVTNVFQADHFYRPAQLGLDRPQEYFNAGVMLLNLDLLRREERVAALHRYALDHADGLVFRDQDVLNAVLAARRLPLHPRWNCMNSTLAFPWSAYVFGAAAVEEARRRPAIRHFEGPGLNKPWHYLFQGEGREAYFEHRRATPWPKVEMEGATPLNFARRIRRHLGWRLDRARRRRRPRRGGVSA
jgi:lipopolysaccharide biosynthesis glycosyltransferase